MKFAWLKMNTQGDKLITEIDAILPQTQCGQCGYAGCKPYAIAMANGNAEINQCPPGGDVGIHALANLLKVEYKPLNKAHGEYKPKSLALIDETACIGCTLCIQACPVDAILGASKQMHTVIASECTGCELCIAPCPVDCISMLPLAEMSFSTQSKLAASDIAKHAANIARQRHEFRVFRIERQQLEQAAKYINHSKMTSNGISGQNNQAGPTTGDSPKTARQAAITNALNRAKSQKIAEK